MPEPVAVITVETEAEGERACERLRESGIKCGVSDVSFSQRGENPRAFMRLGLGPGPRIKQVFVAEEDLDRARAVLAHWPD